MDESTPSTNLGRYLLLRKIGQGGMGDVWLAQDPRLQRQVALKVLPSRKQEDQEFLARFEREARAAAALHHPHILPVHDYGQQRMSDGQTVTYLVMSYVSGGSLADRLQALSRGQETMTQEDALTFLAQIAEAIDYAHAAGIIHRDIKPANMLLREDNWLLLTDFGIARILSDENSSTRTGTFLGSPAYMAPEQAQGQAVPASDIYSLAIVAYQFFAGRLPFSAENPYALTFQHAFAPPPSPRLFNPALPEEFEVALLRGMIKDPARRPRSAVAFVTDLRHALENHLAISGSLPAVQSELPEPQATPEPEPLRHYTRRKVLLGVGAGAVLLGGGAAVYFFSPLGHSRSLTQSPTATPQLAPTATVSTAQQPLALTAAFTQPVQTMSWSSAKNTLVAISQDSNALIWDLSSSIPVQGASQVVGLEGGTQLCWSPDGTKLAAANADMTASDDYETVLYQANFSAPVANLSESAFLSQGQIQGVGWLSNTLLAVVASGDTSTITQSILTVWNIQQPRQKLLSVTLNDEMPEVYLGLPNVLAVSPKDATLAMSLEQGVLLGRLNNNSHPTGWRQVGSLLAFNSDPIGQLSWSGDGRYLSAANAAGAGGGLVGVWDATKQYQQVLPQLDATSLSGPVTNAALSPTAQPPLVAFGVADGQVYLWNPGVSAQPLRALAGTIENKITALCWSHDGQWLAVSYSDAAATILLWRI